MQSSCLHPLMRPNEAKNFSIFHLYSKNKISSGNANDNRSTCLGTEWTKDVTRALPNESSVWVLVTEPTPGPDAACLKRGRLAGNRHVAINRLFTLHLLPSPQLQSTRPPTHEPGTSQHRQKVKGTQTLRRGLALREGRLCHEAAAHAAPWGGQALWGSMLCGPRGHHRAHGAQGTRQGLGGSNGASPAPQHGQQHKASASHSWARQPADGSPHWAGSGLLPTLSLAGAIFKLTAA